VARNHVSFVPYIPLPGHTTSIGISTRVSKIIIRIQMNQNRIMIQMKKLLKKMRMNHQMRRDQVVMNIANHHQG